MDTNLERTLNIYENASHAELIAMLETGDILQKQISALAISQIRNAREAQIFVSNLTGIDGKVREAVSFRLIEFIAAAPELFIPHCESFLKAIIDINGNVCRNVIQALHAIPPEYFCTGLLNMTREILKNVPKDEVKGYKVNKELFKLYWCLEAICEFCAEPPVDILHAAKEIHDYTIREKVAKGVNKWAAFAELEETRQALKADPNYYVRRL